MTSSTMADTSPELHRNRLPTLHEVLTRTTLPPVDLFNLYIYMRDTGSFVDLLDFWLDVNQHLVLCRHYVRELHRSTLIETPDPSKAGSKRSSAILENLDLEPVNNVGQSIMEEKAQNQRVSAFLRSGTGNDPSPHPSSGSNQSGLRQSNEPGSAADARTRQTLVSSDQANSSSPGHTIAREDLVASAEKILYTYVLPGSEREIPLPRPVQEFIISSIEEQGRDDPEVFDGARDWAFQVMERETFPGFLRAKALGNLVGLDARTRLYAGLIVLLGAFWAAFAVVFLDRPKHLRCWVILPFIVGFYLTMTHQYNLDPIIAFIGYSETTPWHFLRIREPYIRQLLNKRAVMVLILSVIFTVALSVTFIFVPGKRL